MEEILKLRQANCKNCYKCIRHCPVKSIRFSGGQAHIVTEECILCGECFVNCPQNAKAVRDDLPRVRQLLASGRPVVASVAPSFIAEFGVSGFAPVRRALQQLGFSDAQETAVGAGLVKAEYQKLVAAGSLPVLITSCCHTVNTLIQKYYPKALPFLAPVITPMQAHCRLIKQQQPGACAVFIGPCISKKQEADWYGGCDAVLTFEELAGWMEAEGVAFSDGGPDESGMRPRFFPIPGGIIASMDTAGTGYTYIAVDGVERCRQVLQEVEAGGLDHCFIEMNACRGGCINGPAAAGRRGLNLAGAARVRRFAGAAEFDPGAKPPMEAQHPFIGTPAPLPDEEQIRAALLQMGKATAAQELNCGSCGYPTCREKAIAVCQGKADLTMCLPFLKEKAESFSEMVIQHTPNAILVLDEQLQLQQMNQAAQQLFGLAPQDFYKGLPLDSLLDPGPYRRLVGQGQGSAAAKRYLEKQGRYVDETIVYDPEYRLVIGVLRDITDAEQEAAQKDQLRRQTVEITDRVIEKQMRTVQEIASLLGETTAETKIALTRLRATLQK